MMHCITTTDMMSTDSCSNEVPPHPFNGWGGFGIAGKLVKTKGAVYLFCTEDRRVA